MACATKTLQDFPRGSTKSNGAQYYVEEHSIVFQGNFVRLSIHYFPRGSIQSNGAQYYVEEHSIAFHGNFVRLSIHYFNLAHNTSL